ncbi:MAG: hypothetical protein AABY00_00260 [Nanoarchaeota archaeon]
MTEKPQSRPEGKHHHPTQQKQQQKQEKKQVATANTTKETKIVTPSIPVPSPTLSPISSSPSPHSPSDNTSSTSTPSALPPQVSSPTTTPSQSPSEKPAKAPAPKPTKKDEAVARGINLHASKKHCMYLCNFIKGKPIDQAISQLQEVLKFKRVIPMKGEIPHRSAPGIMSGRYPIKTTQQFIPLLKALKGNAIVNGLELDKTRITYGSSTWASRPAKRGGMRFKRAFVVLKAREVHMKEKTKKSEKKQEEKK